MWPGRHNNQTDQQASTSSSGLEHGRLGQAKDTQQQFTDLMEKLPKDVKYQILTRLGTPDIIRLYRSLDGKHKFLSILDDNKRQEALENLKIGDLAEHFNELKTPDEREKFVRWLKHEQVAALYRRFHNSSNKQKGFLGELYIERIIELYKSITGKGEQKNFWSDSFGIFKNVEGQV
jgi:Mg/Co/Ni transporter MgtE